MSDRFKDLKKIPEQPAARLLASNNAKLETKLDLPANASVPTVLAALEEQEAYVDMIRLLSVSLPPRECVWWSCLAGQDLVAAEGADSTCLKAAEAWVFDPKPGPRERLKKVIETEANDDPADLCATAAFYAPGNLGEGDLAEMPAPIGAVGACCFGANLKTIALGPDIETRFNLIIDRALDIARGGNGQVELPAPTKEEPA